MDSGGRSSTSTLVIRNLDDDVNPPMFESKLYNGTVIENRDQFRQHVQVHVSRSQEC